MVSTINEVDTWMSDPSNSLRLEVVDSQSVKSAEKATVLSVKRRSDVS